MAAPTAEVIGSHMLKEGSGITTDIGLLLAIIARINWKEPFLIGLIIFHLFCFGLILWLRKRPYVLSVLLLILGLLCLSSEYINEWAAANSRHFLSEQYFDSTGVFIALVFSLPLLLQCFIILICLLVESCSVMQQLAVIKIKAKAKNTNKQKQN